MHRLNITFPDQQTGKFYRYCIPCVGSSMHKATMFNFTVQDQKKKSNEGGRGLGGKKTFKKKKH